MKKPGLLLLASVLFIQSVCAQKGTKLPEIHSHNDYHQSTPFYLAYDAGATSIEIDVFLINDTLFVAHSKNEIKKERTIETLYFTPLQNLSKKSETMHPVNFLVDIKTVAEPALKKLIETAAYYPAIFNHQANSVKLIVSGNRPKQATYSSYPPYLLFDGRNPEEAEKSGAEKIAMISRDFSDFTHWKGNGNLSAKDTEKLKAFITECHSKNKAVRFWNTPDNMAVYKKLIELKANYINTDKPYIVAAFLEGYEAGKKVEE